MKQKTQRLQIQTPSRVDIFGTKFSNVNLESATTFLTSYNFESPGYVCFPSTGFISVAYENKEYRNILNRSLLTLVDGQATEYYARLKGYRKINAVSGYWLMENLLNTNFSHYFYGCEEDVLAKLALSLRKRFPNANILGYRSPPVLGVDEIYLNPTIIDDFKYINSLSPDFIWVGISTPKQDYLMHHYRNFLSKGVLLGVGAVFLYHAGVVSKGPEIFKKLSLRWVIRLFYEPKRMLKKKPFLLLYKFLVLILKHDILMRKINP